MLASKYVITRWPASTPLNGTARIGAASLPSPGTRIPRAPGLEEAVRTRECPGIYFADEPAGRVAKVAGTGLGVWEVMRDYRVAKGDARKLRRWLSHLSAAQIKAATVYYAKFPQEIDAEIADDIEAHAEGRTTQQTIARRM